MEVLVEDQTGELVPVHPVAGCRCDEWRSTHSCQHWKLFRQSHTWSFYWLAVSGFHKCIRANDLKRAINFARIMAKLTNADSPVKYTAKILLEEGRSLRLLREIRESCLSPKDQLHRVVLLRKKWALDYLNQPSLHISTWNRGFALHLAHQRAWTPNDMFTALLHFDTLEIGYSLLPFLRVHKRESTGGALFFNPPGTWDDLFWYAMEDRARREKNERLLDLTTMRSSGYYYKQLAVELALGVWNSEADECEPSLNKVEFFIPRIQTCFHDTHTRHGLKNMIRFKDAITSNQLSAYPKIDLRLSGALFGVHFRCAAIQKYGSLFHQGKLIDWKDVPIDADEWTQTLHHNRWWYPKLGI